MRKLNLAAALSIASLAVSAMTAGLVPHQRHYRYRGSGLDREQAQRQRTGRCPPSGPGRAQHYPPLPARA
jgi:hypothetical protein